MFHATGDFDPNEIVHRVQLRRVRWSCFFRNEGSEVLFAPLLSSVISMGASPTVLEPPIFMSEQTTSFLFIKWQQSILIGLTTQSFSFLKKARTCESRPGYTQCNHDTNWIFFH